MSTFLRKLHVHQRPLVLTHSVDIVNFPSQQYQWIHETSIYHGGNKDYLWFQNHGVLITAVMNATFSVSRDGS